MRWLSLLGVWIRMSMIAASVRAIGGYVRALLPGMRWHAFCVCGGTVCVCACFTLYAYIYTHICVCMIKGQYVYDQRAVCVFGET
jgi:hypothetical protein